MQLSILERKDSIVNQVYDRLISCEEFLGRYGIKIERVIPKGVHMTQELRREIWEIKNYWRLGLDDKSIMSNLWENI